MPNSPASRFAVWLHAARPKTLWAAVAPVLLGTALAAGDGALHPVYALAALAGACLIQVGTNFANDYGDFRRGADAQDRKGPLRVTQAGLVAPRTMLAATALVFAAAAGFSLVLVGRGGWPLLLVGALAILSGILYTAGPWPLAYIGLGDLFVLVFFGPVAVGGTYYVQALSCPPHVLVAGCGPGLLAVAILVVNNLRDADGDARAGKRTLAVRFGKRFARVQYAACVAGAAVVPVALVATRAEWGRSWAMAAAAVLPLLGPALRTVFTATDPALLNPVLGITARGLLVYSVLFACGWLL